VDLEVVWAAVIKGSRRSPRDATVLTRSTHAGFPGQQRPKQLLFHTTTSISQLFSCARTSLKNYTEGVHTVPLSTRFAMHVLSIVVQTNAICILQNVEVGLQELVRDTWRSIRSELISLVTPITHVLNNTGTILVLLIHGTVVTM
jgi:hypothetical protein